MSNLRHAGGDERAQPGLHGVRIGRIAGVMVTMDWSLLIIFGLITLALAGGLLPSWHPDWGALVTWLTAAVAAALFLVSVLVHELAHAVVGRRLGVRVRHITLFVLGGLAHMESEPRTWRAELGMALAGPLMSLALGVGSLVLAGLVAGPIELDPADPTKAIARLGPVATVLFWLGPVNILLGLFNLVPGFPLDGGRVLRALLWGLTGDLLAATRWAAGAGRVFGWVLIASGFAMILGLRVPLLGSGPVAGVWIALIGWFLNSAAVMSLRRVVAEQWLGGVPASKVMERDFVAIPPGLSVRALIDEHLIGTSHRVFPVVDDGQLLGLVCVADLRKVSREEQALTPVSAVMTPLVQLQVLGPSDTAGSALDRLTQHGVNQLPVVDQGRLLGLVSREDILTWLALRRGGSGESMQQPF